MKLEYMLLGVLALGPRTGYGLKKYFDTFGRFLRSNTQMSQIYRTLTRMEKDGYVVSHTVEGDGRKANEYSITDEGFTILIDWLSGPYEPPSRFKDPDFEARLAFSCFLTIDQTLYILDTEIAAREQQVRTYRNRDRSLTTSNPDCDIQVKTLLDEITHRQGCDEMDHHIAYVKRLKAELIALKEQRQDQ